MMLKLLKLIKGKHLLIALCTMLVTMVACSNDSDQEYNEEQAISSYIELLQRDNENLVYSYIDGVHKIQNQAGDNIIPVDGDSIYFYYAAYIFRSGTFSVYDTNVLEVAREAGLDTLNRSFDPRADILSGGKYIKGLYKGLKQINNQEAATIIFSSKQGYGDEPVGLVAPNSSLAFDIHLVRVVKRRP